MAQSTSDSPKTPASKYICTIDLPVVDPNNISPDRPPNPNEISPDSFFRGPSSTKFYNLVIYLDSKEIELPDRCPSPTPPHGFRAVSAFFDPENEIGDEIFDEYPFLKDIPTPLGSPNLEPATPPPHAPSPLAFSISPGVKISEQQSSLPSLDSLLRASEAPPPWYVEPAMPQNQGFDNSQVASGISIESLKGLSTEEVRKIIYYDCVGRL